MHTLLNIITLLGEGPVRFILPSFFWILLLLIADREWRGRRERRDFWVLLAAGFGLGRELLLLSVELGLLQRLFPAYNFEYILPPLEHLFSMCAGLLVGYAFVQYFLPWRRGLRALAIAGVAAAIIIYAATAALWPPFLGANPGRLFGAFWGDMVFRVAASAVFALLLGSLAAARQKGVSVPAALFLAVFALFLDDFLMIFNLATGEAYKYIYSPIRHNIHTLEIFLFVAVYWQEMLRSLKISEQKYMELNTSLEERVRRRTEELEFALKELDSFSYSVSHDLQSPLRAIEGYSQILLKDHAAGIGKEGGQYLERIRASALKMRRLIDNILSVSRLDNAAFKPADIDVDKLARLCAEELAPAYEGREVAFRFNGLGTERWDESLLNEVFSNLISNAVKFTRTRSKAVIEIGMQEKNGERVYYVKDNGIGFSMENSAGIFKKFSRLHPEREFEGTGIGLSIVRRLVSRQGGRAWAEGEVDKGATFCFTLKIDKMNEPAAPSRL